MIRRLINHFLLYVRAAALVCGLVLIVRADPVSTIFTVAVLKSIFVSVAVSAATYGLQRLLIRPKPLQQGKRDGSTQIQDSQWGLFINEIYGARPEDGKGGCKHAGNIIDASEIRKRVTTSTVDNGGKGGPSQKVEETSYYQDLDVAFGKGRQRFLQIWFVGASGAKLVYDITQSTTGVIDPDFPPESPYDHFKPASPIIPDTNPAERYSLVPEADDEGMIEVRLLDGTFARLYEGNESQLPDPLFETIHGAGNVPASRGIAHIVFENLNITNGHPNILVVSENKDYQTLNEVMAVRSEMAGVGASDVDYSELSSKEVRGFIVDSRRAPRADMELLARVYDADFYEGTNGKINGVLVDEDIFETIDGDYMGAVEGEGREKLSPTGSAREKDEVDLPFRVDFSCSDPDNNHETATRHATRQMTTSDRHETLDLPLTLTSAELQRLANRELQEMWREQGSFVFKTTHRYKHLFPSKKIRLPFKDELRDVRIKQVTGGVPGVLTFTCVPADGIILDSIGDAGGAPVTGTPTIPGNTVITLIDIPRIYSPQDGPGFMWAAAPRDATSGDWQTASLYVNKGSGYQYADTAPGPATMGVVVTSALPDVPGGWTEGSWDTVSTVTLDLYYGEPTNLTDAQVLDGDGIYVIGNEVIGISDWVAVGGFPNRWTGSRMQRRLKGTSSAGHEVGERAVLLNNAVRFMRVDESEKDVERTYKAVTRGLVASQRLEDAAPVAFEWTGQTILTDDTIEGTFTADTLNASTGEIDNIVSDDIDGTLIKGAQVRIGGGTNITKHLSATATYDPPSLADGASAATTVTVTGAQVGDTVNVGFSGIVAGVLVSGQVTATNTVTVNFYNISGGTVDMASGTLRADVWQH